MNFEDKLILALLREAKKDEEDPDVENIFGIPMRKVPRPSEEEMKKIKGKKRNMGTWSDEKRKFKRSMGEIPPVDPNADQNEEELDD
tara:strand:+ start:6102 stop:6362 length:261 start_codon:yes stop_codon:yes gene_type:complete